MRPLICLLLTLVSLHSLALTQEEAARWDRDIDVYAENLVELHIDPFNTITRQHFESEIGRIKRSLAQLTRNELLVELMRLTHSINDGHTSFPLWGMDLHSFPLGLKALQGDYYVISSNEENSALLGARLVAINGLPVTQIAALFSEITPFSENRFSKAQRTAQYLTKSELLNGLGVIDEDHLATFVFDVKGKQEQHRFIARKSPELGQSLSYVEKSPFSPQFSVNESLWFGASKSGNTVYLKFRRYAPFEKTESLADALLSAINKQQAQNLIIDLRDNYGGDFFLGLLLAQRLVLADSIDWKSGVFVLIDNVTFSAAMSNAAQYAQLLNAKLVGEPTGARPSGYQDMGQFQLPNSELEVTYSKRLYHFADTQADALYPDVLVEISIDDYLTQNDAQLRVVLDELSARGSL